MPLRRVIVPIVAVVLLAALMYYRSALVRGATAVPAGSQGKTSAELLPDDVPVMDALEDAMMSELGARQAKAEAVPPPADAPAYTTFKKAYEALTTEPDSWSREELGKHTPAGHYEHVPAGQNPYRSDPALAARDTVLKANAESLRILRQGLTEAYYEPHLNYITDMPLFPYYMHLRSLARLLSVEVESHAGHERWNAAVDSVCDIVSLGGQIQHGGDVMPMTIGCSIQATGKGALRRVLPYLDTPALHRAVDRLPVAFARQAAMSEILDRVTEHAEDLVVVAFAKGTTREHLADLLEGYSRAEIRAVKRKRTEASLAEYPPRLRAVIDQPFGSVPLPDKPADALIDYHFQIVPTGWAKHTIGLASRQVLITQVALRAFRLDHGDHPPDLTALVPNYLAEPPTDPFAVGPLTYRRTADGYLLYSLGPNRKDDGGAKFVYPADQSEAANFLTAAGDIVE